jgi:hypothetical protein
LKENQKDNGIQHRIHILKRGNQPPKNNKIIKVHIKIILQYSAKKKKAKVNEAYSTLYPETNSDSASGKSKGNLLVSANKLIKNNKKDGNKGIIFQKFIWLKTIRLN